MYLTLVHSLGPFKEIRIVQELTPRFISTILVVVSKLLEWRMKNLDLS